MLLRPVRINTTTGQTTTATPPPPPERSGVLTQAKRRLCLPLEWLLSNHHEPFLTIYMKHQEADTYAYVYTHTHAHTHQRAVLSVTYYCLIFDLSFHFQNFMVNSSLLYVAVYSGKSLPHSLFIKLQNCTPSDYYLLNPYVCQQQTQATDTK